jgi:protoporphyrinogen oxidase
LESDKEVGGISRTVNRNGWKFDIGGHRFFTKVEEVYEIWNEILDEKDFLMRPRMSRIYYKNKFYDYPLKALNALTNLGLFEAVRCVLSYFFVRLKPPKDQSNFENWVASRFGWRLYNIFFKTYTEKVWGIEASKIGSDWASQRIKNLSLMKAILNAFNVGKSQEIITTLIDEFKYPKFGPGMMWETAYEKLIEKNHRILLQEKVTSITKIEGSYEIKTENNRIFYAKSILSSMPLAHLPKVINPAPNKVVLEAGKSLKFRDFLSVALVVNEKDSFPDNWIYIHDPDVKVGRVQNYGSWSPYMVKDGKTCLGLEYFVDIGDELWEMEDSKLIQLATQELEQLNLISQDSVLEGYVVRMPKAYPVYDLDYKQNITIIQEWLTKEHSQIYPIGRNGMHRYNNQDHSMMTAVKSIRNILMNQSNDIWNINVEEDYHEEITKERIVPEILDS